MDIFYTSSLFYRKFPYKIVLVRQGESKGMRWKNGWTHKKSLIWLNQKNISYRSNCRVRQSKKTGTINVTMRIFLENEKDYNDCLTKWQKYIVSTTRPYNQNHEDTLKNNEKIIIRKNLLYGKFRYIIRFRWNRTLMVDGELIKWLRENLVINHANHHIKWKMNSWVPKVYTNDLSDLTLIKLVWSEQISEIIAIKTLDELEN